MVVTGSAAWSRIHGFMARLAVLVLVLVGVPVVHAHAPIVAAPQGIDVQWSAPSKCPDRAAVVRSIEQWLTRARVEASGVAARGIVEAHAKGYRVMLSVTTPEGTSERVLEAGSCAELASTAALIIAMAIDERVLEEGTGQANESGGNAGDPNASEPNANGANDRGADASEPNASDSNANDRGAVNRGAARGNEDAGLPEAPTATRAREPQANEATSGEPADSPRVRESAVNETASNEAPTRRPESRPGGPPRGYGRVQAGLSLGPLPDPAAALVLGLAIGGPWFRVELTGSGSPPVESAPARAGPGRVRTQLWAGGVRACGVPHVRRLEVPLCLGTDVGAMIAEGRALPRTDRARSLWVVVVASAGIVWWPFERFGLDARVEGLVAARRPVFTIDPGRLAHRAGPFGLTVLVGPAIRLP